MPATIYESIFLGIPVKNKSLKKNQFVIVYILQKRHMDSGF